MAIDVERLKELELKYGGMYRDARRINSPHDPRPTGSDRGGDRMVYQNYAHGYSQVLPDEPQIIVEMGIFKGTGLALWGDLYPGADIIGLDIDLTRYDEHVPELVRLGAWPDGNYPYVLAFDEFEPASWEKLGKNISWGSVDVWVDDACHDSSAILHAFSQAKVFMKPGSVYIIEDNSDVAETLRRRYPSLDIQSWGEDKRLTTIRL